MIETVSTFVSVKTFDNERPQLDLFSFLNMKPLDIFKDTPLFHIFIFVNMKQLDILSKYHCLRGPFNKRPLFKIAL